MGWDVVGHYYQTEDIYSFFTIQDLIDLGNKYPDHVFKFVETNYSPQRLMSWRGCYSLPAIEYGTELKTGKQIAKFLVEQLNETHYGYKGGEYTYNPNQEFYVASYGCNEETKIISHEVFNNEVVLLTKNDPY